ncbi:MAG: M20/M25/M40 family metallo-hydrolase [Acidimicrobiales bacterium]
MGGSTDHETDTDREIRVDLLRELVGINSVNPLQAGPRSGPGGEEALARWLAGRAETLGATTVLDEVSPGRPNVYAEFPGGLDGRVMIDVHLDTVGVEHVPGDPFRAEVRGDRVHGRGAVDTKATLAVLLPLLARLDPARRPTVHLVGTVGEEAGGLLGAYRLADWFGEHDIRLDQIVVAEPTGCRPVHGHKGGVGLEITVAGAAAHSSKPELGANAIEGAARVVAAFVTEQDRIRHQPASTPVGVGSLSVTEISGGLARNIIPDRCTVYAGRRIAPGEDPEAEFVRLSTIAAEAAAPLEIEVTMANGRCSPAFYQDPSSPLVATLTRLGEGGPATAGYGSNALVYRDIADEIVVFGPGSIDQAHQADEWIDISELDRAAAVYHQFLTAGPATPAGRPT